MTKKTTEHHRDEPDRLPPEPPVGSARWDAEGDLVERWPDGWYAPEQAMGPEDQPMMYQDLAHPLSSSPPPKE